MKNNYDKLSSYYKNIVQLFDLIHSNSSIAEEEYKKYYQNKEYKRVPISHSDIKDNRQLRKFEDKNLKIIFVGNPSAYKGLPLLLEILHELYNDGCTNWSLNVWGAKGSSTLNNISYKGSFKQSELNEVYSKDSLLIVPSIWSETFGFTALEALSFGMPAMVSATVGSKNIIEEYDSWFIFENKVELKNKLRTLILDKSKLRVYSQKIMSQAWTHDMAHHALEIEKLYF